jgi:hypothetical protein
MTIGMHHKSRRVLPFMLQCQRITHTTPFNQTRHRHAIASLSRLVKVPLRTLVNIGPHHEEHADREDAELDDERVEVGLEVLVDALNVFGSRAVAGDGVEAERRKIIIVIGIAAGVTLWHHRGCAGLLFAFYPLAHNGVGRFCHDGQDPEAQLRANGVHEHDPCQPLPGVDDHAAVLEDEDEHGERIDRKHDVDGELEQVAAGVRIVGGGHEHVRDVVSEREDRVDEQAEAETRGAELEIEELTVTTRDEAVVVRNCWKLGWELVGML